MRLSPSRTGAKASSVAKILRSRLTRCGVRLDSLPFLFPSPSPLPPVIGGDPPIQLTNLQEELTYLLSTVKEFGCNPFDIDFVSFEFLRTRRNSERKPVATTYILHVWRDHSRLSLKAYVSFVLPFSPYKPLIRSRNRR